PPHHHAPTTTTNTTYTLSLHDALPISRVQLFPKCKIREVQRSTEFVALTESGEFRAPILVVATGGLSIPKMGATAFGYDLALQLDRKSTRLNSSHLGISYAVFCLKKKS